jgi:hypothetical protein
MTKARDIASAPIAPSTVSATELGYVDGVTSAIQTQLDAKTAKSTLTTTGDIYYASAANTPARLGIGSTDQVLKVTAGIPAWATPAAGGMTLISTTSLTGSTINLTSIPTTYKHLQLIVTEVYSAGYADFFLRLNNDSAASAYNQAVIRDRSGTVSAYQQNAQTRIRLGALNNASTALNLFSMVLNLPRYTDTTQNAIVNWNGRIEADASGSGSGIGAGYYANRSAAITQINLICDGSTFSAGTAYLYGVQ